MQDGEKVREEEGESEELGASKYYLLICFCLVLLFRFLLMSSQYLQSNNTFGFAKYISRHISFVHDT